MQIRLYGITKCLLLYSLYLPLAFASGTYVPPVTSFSTNENTYNVGKEYLYRESRNRTRTSPKSAKSPACSSCHSGAKAFTRGKLLENKDRLEEIIRDCNGPHKVYCRGGSSSMANRAGTIAYTLKVRYGLGS